MMVPRKKSKRIIKITNGDARTENHADKLEQAPGEGAEVPSALQRALEQADEAERDVLMRRIEELEEEKASMEDELVRERAKLQNTRRRADEEKAEALKYASYDLAFDLLKVLDCFEMGVNCSVDVPPEVLKPYIEGVEYTIAEMTSTLKRHGIEEIPTDIPYDPELHQVFECVEDEGKKHGTIIDVKRKGYRLHDRVLRTALVTIAGPANGYPSGKGDDEAEGASE
jgi:molecular chaperone GrpE